MPLKRICAKVFATAYNSLVLSIPEPSVAWSSTTDYLPKSHQWHMIRMTVIFKMLHYFLSLLQIHLCTFPYFSK